MFKRNEPETPSQTSKPTAIPPTSSSQTTMNTPPRQETSTKPSIIGASAHFKGDVSGNEDLTIEGIVEGSVNLKQNTVYIGKGGRVIGNIHARVIHVEGEINGDLFASESVIVHRSGCVRGNINCPRVTLEDGAKLKGAIDTDNAAVDGRLNSSGDPASRNDANKYGQKKQENTSSSTSAPALQ